jgi:hypothetical protein
VARKVRKAQRGASGKRAAAEQGSRWTVRGVPADLQKAAGDAARARGLTLGQWLTEALEAAVGRDAPHAAAAPAGWTDAIERRLERLERAVFPEATATAAAAGAAPVN